MNLGDCIAMQLMFFNVMEKRLEKLEVRIVSLEAILKRLRSCLCSVGAQAAGSNRLSEQKSLLSMLEETEEYSPAKTMQQVQGLGAEIYSELLKEMAKDNKEGHDGLSSRV